MAAQQQLTSVGMPTQCEGGVADAKINRTVAVKKSFLFIRNLFIFVTHFSRGIGGIVGMVDILNQNLVPIRNQKQTFLP